MKYFKIFCITRLAAFLLGFSCASAIPAKPVAWWDFNESDNKVAGEKISAARNEISGYAKHVEGINGLALKFDGFTTRVRHKADPFIDIADGFSIEAWIAPQEYSWNWTGLVDQEKDHSEGFSFAIDYMGRIGLGVAIEGKWHEFVSKESVPLLKWTHVAAVFDPAEGITLFINGQTVGSHAVEGNLTVSKADLWIGMSHTNLWPALTEREISKIPTPMVFDGLIDEVKLYNEVIRPEAVMAAYESVAPNNSQPLQYRKMPSGPVGPGPFGAYYTCLQYCEEWDRLWRVSEYPDIVVRFDESPVKVIFWRGTGYCPAWITENDCWVSDQGAEIFKGMCFEHMSDKQCRFSHVRIIENTPARVLVHWRTALPNVKYEFTEVDSQTNWGPWDDEYYYIYPDGVCVRYQRAWGPNIHEFQQSEVLCQPGAKPQDKLEVNAVTVMDLEGNANTYSWETAYGERLPAKQEVNGPVQIINLKSKNRYFVIGEIGAYFKPFTFGAREGYSNFPNWNHWPVAQLPNDGRIAPAPDRPSSSCPGTLYPVRHKGDGVQQYVRNLYGMTDRDPKQLAVLARSWNNAPELELHNSSFIDEGYDKNQRAYVLSKKGDDTLISLTFDIQASRESPIVNPAFVVKNWGDCDAILKLNDRKMKSGRGVRFGHRLTLEGTDLIVWIETESINPVTVSIIPDD
jgi:hypothetical protein